MWIYVNDDILCTHLNLHVSRSAVVYTSAVGFGRVQNGVLYLTYSVWDQLQDKHNQVMQNSYR